VFDRNANGEAQFVRSSVVTFNLIFNDFCNSDFTLASLLNDLMKSIAKGSSIETERITTCPTSQ
jgi:hypothetical protein